MFPDKDETVPKLRFKGFDGEWKQRKLDEISKIVMGQSPKGENYTSNPNDYILVQGNADIKNKKVFPRVWTTQVTKIAKKNSIILCVRAPVGNVVRTNYDVVIGRGVAAIEGNEFIYQLLQQLDNSGYWIPISTGSTFESISSNDIKMVKTLFPNEFEQEKIGSILRKIDQLLTHQESKLEKLKQTKNFFLQKMFI
nr:restriction endonuclease subunit S [Bombilactobacillus thymidiniphilus]